MKGGRKLLTLALGSAVLEFQGEADVMSEDVVEEDEEEAVKR